MQMETPMEPPAKKVKRPYFDVRGNIVTAAGCLIYKCIGPDIYMLLIRYGDPQRPLLDDFGGRVDVDDKSVDETIERELSEETNGLIKKVPGEYVDFYIHSCKYLCRMVEVPSNFYEDTKVFGDMELHGNIHRTVAWYKCPVEGLSKRLSTFKF